MPSDGEREVMALMLITNAEIVATVLRGENGTQAEPLKAAIAATRTLALLVDDTLRALVRQARDRGATWAEIGEVLHVTRQAAFQRFGGQPDAAEGEQPAARPIPGAGEKARRIVEQFMAGQWDDLRASFDARARKAATIELLSSTLESGSKTFGEFVAWGTPVTGVTGDYTVVDLPMAFEKGELTARVSFNADEQVAGLFFLPADRVPGEDNEDEADR
jgi:hypothetical protein